MDWVSELGKQVVRRWFALAAAVATLVSVVGFAVSQWRWWAWIAIAALFLLVVSFAWTLRDVYRLGGGRQKAELRSRLMRQIRQGDQLRGRWPPDAASLNPRVDWVTETYALLNESIGPVKAARFAEGQEGDPRPNPMNPMSLTPRISYLQELLDGIDSLTIMEDWQP